MATASLANDRVTTAVNGSRAGEKAAMETAELFRLRYVVTTAERAECTCPDFCERDHDND